MVTELAPFFPDVTMELVDTTRAAVPDNVFATPTYVLNGRVVSLGNPTRERLGRLLVEARLTQAATQELRPRPRLPKKG